MEVRWRAGSTFTKISPENAYDELESIKQGGGGIITAHAVVDRARDKDNALHDGFDWDDFSAAEKHRLSTARNLIRSIQVIRHETPAAEEGISAYYNISREPAEENTSARRVYMSLDDILNDPQARRSLLEKAIKEAIVFRKNYEVLNELVQITGAIKSTVKELDEVLEATS